MKPYNTINMTEQLIAQDDIIRYSSPQIKVVSVKSRCVLCGSLFGEPDVNDYNEGSNSYIGFGDEEE